MLPPWHRNAVIDYFSPWWGNFSLFNFLGIFFNTKFIYYLLLWVMKMNWLNTVIISSKRKKEKKTQSPGWTHKSPTTFLYSKHEWVSKFTVLWTRPWPLVKSQSKCYPSSFKITSWSMLANSLLHYTPLPLFLLKSLYHSFQPTLVRVIYILTNMNYIHLLS